MRPVFLALVSLLAPMPALAANVLSQPLLVARQSGSAWIVEGPQKQAIGPVVRLDRNQRIIVIDSRGVRQFQGPGEVHLSARPKQQSLFDIAFRTIAPADTARQSEVVRGGAETPAPPADAAPTPIVPRDRAEP